jgi:hypothetical protein
MLRKENTSPSPRAIIYEINCHYPLLGNSTFFILLKNVACKKFKFALNLKERGKELLGRKRHRRVDNIKMDLR